MNVSKMCFKCGVEQPINQFYRHKMMADGHLGKCKECTKIDVTKNRHGNAEKYLAYDKARANLPKRVAARREYAKTEAGHIAAKHGTQNFRANYPLKYAAHTMVHNAIRDGAMLREPCEICGEVVSQAHHEDYTRPLDVTWLCQRHHTERHNQLRALGIKL